MRSVNSVTMGKKWNVDNKDKFKEIKEERSTKPSFKSSKKDNTGNIASLGNHVFYIGGNADKSGYHYERTVEKLSEHIQVEHGNGMWTLVTTGTECRPTEPKEPTGTRATSNSWAVDRYKLEYAHYLKLSQEYDRDKAKTFAMVYGQCTEAMKNKLKTFPDHDDVSRNANVIKLLERIKKLMLGDNQEQYHYWTMTLSMFRSATCKQGAKESLEGYYIRWCTQVKVLESKWGSFAPSKTFSSQGTTVDKERFQACMFLHSLHQDRYRNVLEELNNSFLQGNLKAYPSNPDAAMRLVSQWMNSKNKRMISNHDEEASKLNFMQTNEEEEEEDPEESNDTEEVTENDDLTDDLLVSSWQF